MVGTSMARHDLPHSLRKFIRSEKSRLRREIFDPADADKKISDFVGEVRERYSKKKK